MVRSQNNLGFCVAVPTVRFGSITVVQADISSMSGFGVKGDTEQVGHNHIKTGTRPGFRYSGSGGVLCTDPIFKVPTKAACTQPLNDCITDGSLTASPDQKPK